MPPPRLLLSDARIATLEATVARLIGRVTVLEASFPDPPSTNPSVLRSPSPLQAPGPTADSFAAAAFPLVHSLDAGALTRPSSYHYPCLDYAPSRDPAADASATQPGLRLRAIPDDANLGTAAFPEAYSRDTRLHDASPLPPSEPIYGPA